MSNHDDLSNHDPSQPPRQAPCPVPPFMNSGNHPMAMPVFTSQQMQQLHQQIVQYQQLLNHEAFHPLEPIATIAAVDPNTSSSARRAVRTELKKKLVQTDAAMEEAFELMLNIKEAIKVLKRTIGSSETQKTALKEQVEKFDSSVDDAGTTLFSTWWTYKKISTNLIELGEEVKEVPNLNTALDTTLSSSQSTQEPVAPETMAECVQEAAGDQMDRQRQVQQSHVVSQHLCRSYASVVSAAPAVPQDPMIFAAPPGFSPISVGVSTFEATQPDRESQVPPGFSPLGNTRMVQVAQPVHEMQAPPGLPPLETMHPVHESQPPSGLSPLANTHMVLVDQPVHESQAPPGLPPLAAPSATADSNSVASSAPQQIQRTEPTLRSATSVLSTSENQKVQEVCPEAAAPAPVIQNIDNKGKSSKNKSKKVPTKKELKNAKKAKQRVQNASKKTKTSSEAESTSECSQEKNTSGTSSDTHPKAETDKLTSQKKKEVPANEVTTNPKSQGDQENEQVESNTSQKSQNVKAKKKKKEKAPRKDVAKGKSSSDRSDQLVHQSSSSGLQPVAANVVGLLKTQKKAASKILTAPIVKDKMSEIRDALASLIAEMRAKIIVYLQDQIIIRGQGNLDKHQPCCETYSLDWLARDDFQLSPLDVIDKFLASASQSILLVPKDNVKKAVARHRKSIFYQALAPQYRKGLKVLQEDLTRVLKMDDMDPDRYVDFVLDYFEVSRWKNIERYVLRQSKPDEAEEEPNGISSIETEIGEARKKNKKECINYFELPFFQERLKHCRSNLLQNTAALSLFYGLFDKKSKDRNTELKLSYDAHRVFNFDFYYLSQEFELNPLTFKEKEASYCKLFLQQRPAP